MSELPTHPPPAYPPPPPPPSPRRRALPVVLAVVLAVVAALLLAGVAVTVPLLLRSSGEATAGPASLADVRKYDDLEVAHTTDDVDYPQSPPVGGPHAPVWLDCGVYDEPVRDENVVHDLEHGTVWIAYDPEAGVDVDAIAEVLPQDGIISPYDGLGAPVVVTVWGRQLALDGADDPRLELFIDTYGGGETAPEPFASCSGGIQDPGGEPGADV